MPCYAGGLYFYNVIGNGKLYGQGKFIITN